MRASEVFSSLRSTYDDWNPELLINQSFIRRKNSISWIQFCQGKTPDRIYQSDVAQMEESGQYSFQAKDGSIFQLYYLYDKDSRTLVKASLAYFNSNSMEGYQNSCPSDIPMPDSGESAIIDESDDLILFNLSEINSEVPWLRIDYSPQTHRGPLHNACHMHIGLMREARISLSCVPTPRQFIEFCISQFYPEQYRKNRLNDEGEPADIKKLEGFNDTCFPPISGSIFSILPYLRIPSPRR